MFSVGKLQRGAVSTARLDRPLWRLGIINSLRYNAKAHQSYVR